MIEVELKLEVDEFPDVSILKNIEEKRLVDIYYDTSDYKLISSGNFLRNRNNKTIDFKLNNGDNSHTFCRETNFDIENFMPNESLIEIFKRFGMELNCNFNSFDEFLKVNNLIQLAVVDKHRKLFAFDELLISLDEAKDIGKFVEIECDLEDGTVFDKDELAQYMITKMIHNGFL